MRAPATVLEIHRGLAGIRALAAFAQGRSNVRLLYVRIATVVSDFRLRLFFIAGGRRRVAGRGSGRRGCWICEARPAGEGSDVTNGLEDHICSCL